MPAPYTGACLCGTVRLAISSEPVAVLSCFCDHCSKGAGGANQIIGKFATSHVEVSASPDAIGTYVLADTSSGNPKEKAFCRTCGCPLWTIPGSARGTFHLIRTALLDQGLELQPGNEIFVKNRPTWMTASPGIQQWEEMRKSVLALEFVRVGLSERLHGLHHDRGIVIFCQKHMVPVPVLSSGGPSTPRGPPKKRLKIDIACDTCRAKKVKCDGVRPACSYCSRKLNLKNNCRYSAGNVAGERNPRRSTGRSSAVGSAIRETPSRVRIAPTPSTGASIAPSVPSSMRSAVQIEPEQTNTMEISGGIASPLAIDSMTAVVGEGIRTGEFFGSSSAGSFTAQIKRAIDASLGKPTSRNCVKEKTPASTSLASPTDLSTRLNTATDVSYVLPPRREADHLMDIYWFYVDPLYPFLDKGSWQRSYSAIFAGTAIEIEERLFLATLNVIFALSTQLIESLAEGKRESSSRVFFQRAQAILPTNPWDVGSLELVQNLLLTSQYLQSTNQAQQTWMVVGSAIRTAQSLGLHLPGTSTACSSPGRRELLRRLWYGCVLMDRMVSVTHGRPAMISEHIATAVPFPDMTFTQADENENHENDRSNYGAFFVKSVQLYEVIHRIVLAFYGDKGTRDDYRCHHSRLSDEQVEDLDIIIPLERSLNKWELGLPDNLRWGRLKESTDEITRRQALILHIRLLHARILLLRPVFSRFCLSHLPTQAVECMNDTLESRLTEQSSIFCVSTAQKIVATLDEYQVSDGTVGLLPAWWYRVYYLYTAASVLITARLRPEAFPVEGLAQSWARAMSLLKSHEKFGSSARRCVAALHILSSKMLEIAPGGPGVQDSTREASPSRDEGDEVTQLQVPWTGSGHDPPLETRHLDAGQEPGYIDDFAPPSTDIGGLNLAEFDFDVNDLSWLNDIHATWSLLNE